jgi:hypothetical protein
MNAPKAVEVSPFTLQEAKQAAQKMENDIAAFVPEEFVENKKQGSKGVLLNCSAEDTYSWSGETLVTLKGQPDIEAVLGQIEAHWEGQSDFQVKRRTARDGTPEVDISGQYGAGYLVGPYPDGIRFLITSHSPCVKYEKGHMTSDVY